MIDTWLIYAIFIFIIGWAICIDNLWKHDSLGQKLNDIDCFSTNAKSLKNLEHGSWSTCVRDKCNSEKELQFTIPSMQPSKRLLQHLLANVTLSSVTVDKFLKLASEQIRSLNLTDMDINICLSQRWIFELQQYTFIILAKI